uniref:Uncharacterized protein n=1 Tax=Tanacetum cinerariifolium TaxID=118510 RepID=A0A699HIU2_TANCI|nr:hypothetical protein [Tanacetum cinerariifolium]
MRGQRKDTSQISPTRLKKSHKKANNHGRSTVTLPDADIVSVLRPTENVLRDWVNCKVTHPDADIVSVLRPTENVLHGWGTCPDANIIFVLRPTKDVLPWLGSTRLKGQSKYQSNKLGDISPNEYYSNMGQQIAKEQDLKRWQWLLQEWNMKKIWTKVFHPRLTSLRLEFRFSIYIHQENPQSQLLPFLQTGAQEKSAVKFEKHLSENIKEDDLQLLSRSCWGLHSAGAMSVILATPETTEDVEWGNLIKSIFFLSSPEGAVVANYLIQYALVPEMEQKKKSQT